MKSSVLTLHRFRYKRGEVKSIIQTWELMRRYKVKCSNTEINSGSFFVSTVIRVLPTFPLTRKDSGRLKVLWRRGYIAERLGYGLDMIGYSDRYPEILLKRNVRRKRVSV